MLTDERYKQLMEDVGLPNSISLLQALKQCAMEAALIERAAPVPAMPIPKQEPAGAVPDFVSDKTPEEVMAILDFKSSERDLWAEHYASSQSPRITEQDAREIIEDYIGYCDGKRLKPQSSVVIGMYIKNECTALLNKLNANAVATQAAAMPEHPTKEMVIAGINASMEGAPNLNDWDYIVKIYKAMLSASPKPE